MITHLKDIEKIENINIQNAKVYVRFAKSIKAVECLYCPGTSKNFTVIRNTAYSSFLHETLYVCNFCKSTKPLIGLLHDINVHKIRKLFEDRNIYIKSSEFFTIII